MMTPIFEIPGLVTATVTMTASALIALLALKLVQPSSCRIHRAVWIAVLLNGVMVSRFAIDLPILQPRPLALRNEVFRANEPATNSNRIYVESPQSSVGPELDERAMESIGHEELAADSAECHSSDGGLWWSFELDTVLFRLWALGLFTALSVLLFRYFSVLVCLAKASEVKGRFQSENRLVSQQLGIRHPVPILFHNRMGPALIMTFNGHRILVPESFWNSINREQRCAILRHEYAHLQRRDIWKSFAATLLAAIQWFNPLAWFAVRRFNEAAEWACDAAVSKHDERQKTGFARALLSLSTSRPKHFVGASTMASSELSVRVQRLLVDQSRDSLTRRFAMTLVVCLLFAIGWVNVRLVAAPPKIGPFATMTVQGEDDETWNRRVQELVSGMSTEDALSKDLAEVLKTPAGKVALSDRVGWVEEQMRQDAIKSIVSDYFDGLQESDVLDIHNEAAKALQDIRQVSAALSELRSKLDGTGDADRMFMRLLDDETAARTLYFGEFRSQIRPGKEQLMNRLGDFLANDGDGKLVVREGVKDRLEQQINSINARKKYLQVITDELAAWSDEVHPKDELHQQIKDGFRRTNAATMVLASFEADNENDPAEQYFEFLEHVFEDGPQGLVIVEERREDVEEASKRMRLQRKKLEIFRRPIDEIAGQIDTRDPIAQLTQDFLKSELGKCMIIREIDYAGTTPDGIAKRIMTEVLAESADNAGLVIREDVREQVVEFVRETFRSARRFRRHARMLDTYVSRLNPPWQSTFSSLEAKAIAFERIEEIAEAKRFDAWPVWMERNLETIAGKHVIQEQAQEEIRELIEDAKTIARELEKDDF